MPRWVLMLLFAAAVIGIAVAVYTAPRCEPGQGGFAIANRFRVSGC